MNKEFRSTPPILRFTDDRPFMTDAVTPFLAEQNPSLIGFNTSTDRITDGTCKWDDGYITWPTNNQLAFLVVVTFQLIAFLLPFFLGG
jgi:hypothetical protein